MLEHNLPPSRNASAGFIIHYKGSILVFFGRDRLLNALLRRVYQPTWQPGIGCWALPEILCKEVTKLLASQLEYLIHSTVSDPHGVQTGLQPHETDWEALQVQPGAPKPVVDAAYKALAILNHPDRNGSNDEMARINAAYERLKKVLV